MSSSSHSPCAACKFLRRKCTQECVFAPYFPPDQPQKFASVHRVYGASNVAKLLNDLPVAHRDEAVASLAYEADARLRDPIYGCVSFISFLHARLKQAQAETLAAKKELAAFIGPQAAMMLLQPYHVAPAPVGGHVGFQTQQMFNGFEAGYVGFGDGVDNGGYGMAVQVQPEQVHHVQGNQRAVSDAVVDYNQMQAQFGLLSHAPPHDNQAHCKSDVGPQIG